MLVLLTAIWAILMLRSGMAEYQYYQSVKVHEPEIWQQLGSPTLLKIPMVFVSPTASKLLKNIVNETVCLHAKKHRQAGIQFLSYIVLVLVVGIAYFKFA